MTGGQFGPLPKDTSRVGPQSDEPSNDVWKNGLKGPGVRSPEQQQDIDDKRGRTQRIAANKRRQREAETADTSGTREDMQPVEQHSPTKIKVPGWKVIVLGGSGGIRVKV